ncbi:MAG: methylated-DNA--[protein]-cysteine S-methyltransferase [Candidatus Syntrophosphaera sp.]
MDIRKTRIFGIGELRISLIDKKVSEISFCRRDTGERCGPPDETRGIRRQLEEYFAGRRKEFEADLNPRGTEFQKAVWKAILDIPYGETRSYAEIAEKIGKPHAYRAVGQAASKNPIAILIPCHRVVGSDGSLTGYAGGADLKTRLLELERRFK